MRIVLSCLALLAAPCASQLTSPPAGYVSMPGQFIHASCVHAAVGDVAPTEEHAQICPYPALPSRQPQARSGSSFFAGGKQEEEEEEEEEEQVSRKLYYSSWVTWAGFSDSSISSFTSSFLVPPPPVDYLFVTTLFFFNGLQDKGIGEGANYILQPVLQYGKSGCGGGNYWSFAAFYVSASGRAYCGQTFKVSPGSELVGSMSRNDADGTWNVVMEDRTANQTSTYTTGTALVDDMKPTFACITMEGIVVYNCRAFPGSDETRFYDNVLLGEGGKEIEPTWEGVVKKNECDQNVRVETDGSGDVTIIHDVHV